LFAGTLACWVKCIFWYRAWLWQLWSFRKAKQSV